MNKEKILIKCHLQIGLNVVFLFFLNYQKLLQNVNVVLNVCSSNDKTWKKKKNTKRLFLYIFYLFFLYTT